MNPILIGAIFIILWWLAFFIMLPMGVRNLDEAGDAGGAGQERAAPAAPNIAKKALWAAGIAAVLLGVVIALVEVDAFGVRG